MIRVGSKILKMNVKFFMELSKQGIVVKLLK